MIFRMSLNPLQNDSPDSPDSRFLLLIHSSPRMKLLVHRL